VLAVVFVLILRAVINLPGFKSLGFWSQVLAILSLVHEWNAFIHSRGFFNGDARNVIFKICQNVHVLKKLIKAIHNIYKKNLIAVKGWNIVFRMELNK
jgi:hypothetical protein